MLVNPFLGKTERPTEEELAVELGAAKEMWDRLIGDLGENGNINVQEWKVYSPKAGWWSLQLKQKERTIAALIPVRKRFRVAFVLGEQAVRAARKSGLSQEVMRVAAEAPRCADGTTFILDVRKPTDLVRVMKLTAIKLEH